MTSLRRRMTEDMQVRNLALSSREPRCIGCGGQRGSSRNESPCVVKYSASLAAQKLHSLTHSVSKAMQSMRKLARELLKPGAAYAESGLLNRIARWLSPQFVSALIN